MSNEQLLLGLLGIVVTAAIAIVTFLIGRGKKNGNDPAASDKAGNQSTHFWLRQFDKIVQATIIGQNQIISRLDRLIELMENRQSR